jgi:hypothetical protein
MKWFENLKEIPGIMALETIITISLLGSGVIVIILALMFK